MGGAVSAGGSEIGEDDGADEEAIGGGRGRGTGFPGRVQVRPAGHTGPVPEEVRDDVRPGKGGAVPDQHGGRGVRQPRGGVARPHPVPDRDRVLSAGNARRQRRRRETGRRRVLVTVGRLRGQTVYGLAGPGWRRTLLVRNGRRRRGRRFDGQTAVRGLVAAARTGPADVALRVPAGGRPEAQTKRPGGVHTGDAGW